MEVVEVVGGGRNWGGGFPSAGGGVHYRQQKSRQFEYLTWQRSTDRQATTIISLSWVIRSFPIFKSFTLSWSWDSRSQKKPDKVGVGVGVGKRETEEQGEETLKIHTTLFSPHWISSNCGFVLSWGIGGTLNWVTSLSCNLDQTTLFLWPENVSVYGWKWSESIEYAWDDTSGWRREILLTRLESSSWRKEKIFLLCPWEKSIH